MLRVQADSDVRALAAQLAKFAAVGLSGVAVNLAVFAALVAAGAPPAAAAVGAFAAAVVNNHAWNARWTFAGHGAGRAASSVRFALVSLGGLAVDVSVLHALVAAGVPPIAGQLAGVAVATPFTYVANRAWTFRPRVAAERAPLERALPTIVAAWALSRGLVLLTAVVVQALRWPSARWYASTGDRPFALLQAWDGRWYRILAARGYVEIPHHQSDTAFFPLFPALMNLLRLAGISTFTGGILIANLSLLAALAALYELARTWVPEPLARRTAVYAALIPVGYVFSMAYPESLVLAAVAGAGAAGTRRRWRLAAALAAVAAVGRPEGVFVTVPLLALALRREVRSQPGELGRALAAAAAAPAALAAVAAYQRLIVGDPLAFSHAQAAWGRSFSLLGAERAVRELLHATGDNLWLARDAAVCVVYVLLLVLARRARVPWPWVATGLAVVLLPLETGSFTSDARFGLLAPAVYVGLARLGASRWADVALRAGMALLLVGATATILDRWP